MDGRLGRSVDSWVDKKVGRKIDGGGLASWSSG